MSNATNRLQLFLARQQRNTTRDTVYVAILIAATAIGLGALTL